MNRKFVKELLGLESTSLVVRAMEERRAQILTAIEEGRIKPDSDAIRELAELNIAIGDAGLDVDNG